MLQYLQEGAHLQVNITGKARDNVEGKLDESPMDLFARARGELHSNMEGDIIPRFKQSEEAKNYLDLNARAEKLRQGSNA